MKANALMVPSVSDEEIVCDIDDPKIRITESWHRDRRTGVLARLLILLAPLANWQDLPAAERDKWQAVQRGRLVQAHRLFFP